MDKRSIDEVLADEGYPFAVVPSFGYWELGGRPVSSKVALAAQTLHMKGSTTSHMWAQERALRLLMEEGLPVAKPVWKETELARVLRRGSTAPVRMRDLQ